MALTLDKPYLGLRASLSGDAVVFVPREGICDGIVLDTPYIGLRAATSGDAVVFLISDQQLTMGGELKINKPYIGLRAANDDGTLVYVVDGKQCDEGEPIPPFCECDICCTLDGTIEMGDGGTGYETGIDFTMTCERTYTTATYTSCYNEDTDDTYCYVVTTTYEGGSGTGESFSFGGFTGTYDWRTVVWVSDAFDIDGDSYRVFLVVTTYDITYVTPAPSTDQQCAWAWGIQRLYTPPPESDFCPCGGNWGTVYSASSGGTNFSAVRLVTTTDHAGDPCAEGYVENGNGECGAPAWCTTPPGYVAFGEGNGFDNSWFTDCTEGGQILLVAAVMFCVFPAGTCPGDGTSVKCFRLTIADNCEP